MCKDFLLSVCRCNLMSLFSMSTLILLFLINVTITKQIKYHVPVY